MNPNDNEYDAWVATRQEENMGAMKNIFTAATEYVDWYDSHGEWIPADGPVDGEKCDAGFWFPSSRSHAKAHRIAGDYGISVRDLMSATEDYRQHQYRILWAGE